MELRKRVVDMALSADTTIDDLVLQMEKGGGFTAKKLAVGVNILESMERDKECTKFLSLTGNLMATGLRGLIRDLIKERLFDVVITTCGALDHDFARVWADYYHGSFIGDDGELRREGIHRLGNIYIPIENYGKTIEKKIQPILGDMWSGGLKEVSTKELCWEIGKRLQSDTSMLYWCWKNRVPIFVPAVTDGAIGSQIWLFSQRHRLKIDVLRDEQELSDVVFGAKRTGALVVGGGVPKHHTIWWNQFKGGLDYVIYVTTGVEWDGSLSGAKAREAISWGKVKERARYVTVEGDATVLLPVMTAALLRRLAIE